MYEERLIGYLSPMASDYLIEDREWEDLDWKTDAPFPGTYDACKFMRCDLAMSKLTGYHFTDCQFIDCDFSNADLRGVVFNDCAFIGCKLTGLHFEDCHTIPFGVRFNGCILTLASFSKMMLRKTVFEDCRLTETDFSGADLRDAVFTGSDLDRAIFSGCNLEKADFRKVINCTINPAQNRMRKAKFSLAGLPGLLSSFGLDIHD
jgi:fluoroquinolone resistance protein